MDPAKPPQKPEPTSFAAILSLTLKIGFSLVILAVMLFFGSAVFAGACRGVMRP